MQSCCFGFGSTEVVGQTFGSFSPRGARSKGGRQPDDRVAHNQKLLNHPGRRKKGFSPPVSCAQGRLVNAAGGREWACDGGRPITEGGRHRGAEQKREDGAVLGD